MKKLYQYHIAGKFRTIRNNYTDWLSWRKNGYPDNLCGIRNDKERLSIAGLMKMIMHTLFGKFWHYDWLWTRENQGHVLIDGSTKKPFTVTYWI